MSGRKKPVTQKKTRKKTKKHVTRLLIATLSLNKDHRMLYTSLQFKNYENVVLLHTGAVQSELLDIELGKFLTAHPKALLHKLPPPTFK